jgi:hypothetical protein
MPEKVGRYFFPPLQDIYRVIAVVLGIVVFAGVYLLQDLQLAHSPRGRLKALGWSVCLAVLGACLFLISQERFVRSIDIPSRAEGVVVSVSVGFERTDFTKTQFPDWSDWKILHDHGYGEEDIWKVWTPRSIIAARLALFSSYLLFLLFTISSLSLAVLFQGLQDAPNP